MKVNSEHRVPQGRWKAENRNLNHALWGSVGAHRVKNRSAPPARISECGLPSDPGFRASGFWSFLQILACCCAVLMVPALMGQTNRSPAAVTPTENSLGMRFVKVPGVTSLFSIWETRVRDYRVFVDDTRREWTEPGFPQSTNDPAVNVSWEDAAAFCQWLTARERKAGRLPEVQRYRLPTDAEWSLAVGIQTESGATPEDRMNAAIIWPWGSAWPPPVGAGNYAPELEVDPRANTSPVGSFKPNRHGLYDLGGNVWEWCDDWFNTTRVTKVLRGGSFHDRQPKDLLATYRFSGTMHLNNDDIGFRLVLETATKAE